MSPRPGSAPLLEVTDLHVAYGPVHAVRGVSLQIAEGEFVTLIGPNGAGKSSLLSALSGLVRPRGGTVRLADCDLTGAPSHRTVAAGLALVPEGRAILGRMTIEENLLLAGEQRLARPDLAKALAGATPVPGAGRAAIRSGWNPVGRAAANAGGGPCAPDAPSPAPPR